MLATFSGLNPKGPNLSLEKENETFCAVFTFSVNRALEIRKFHVAVVQRWLKNVQKSVIHVYSCWFTDINLFLFLPVSLSSPSLMPKLPFLVIPKFCYHGNVTSHFSSLYPCNWYSGFCFEHRFLNKRMPAHKIPVRREKTRLTSPGVRAAGTSKDWRDSGRAPFTSPRLRRRRKEALFTGWKKQRDDFKTRSPQG